MSARKRWHRLYSDENPFALPKAVHRAVRDQADVEESQPIRYLWIVLCEPNLTGDRELSVDEWLSVIDEAAARGANTFIVSVTGELEQRDLMVPLCSWAQDTYDMLVGIHVRESALSNDDLDVFATLEPKQTHVLACDRLIGAMAAYGDAGFGLIVADDLSECDEGDDCALPSNLCCLGADGEMYTCGLVLGEQRYRLGNCLERKLDQVMADETLPHFVLDRPEQRVHRCEGCPPRLVRLLKERL